MSDCYFLHFEQCRISCSEINEFILRNAMNLARWQIDVLMENFSLKSTQTFFVDSNEVLNSWNFTNGSWNTAVFRSIINELVQNGCSSFRVVYIRSRDICYFSTQCTTEIEDFFRGYITTDKIYPDEELYYDEKIYPYKDSYHSERIRHYNNLSSRAEIIRTNTSLAPVIYIQELSKSNKSPVDTFVSVCCNDNDYSQLSQNVKSLFMPFGCNKYTPTVEKPLPVVFDSFPISYRDNISSIIDRYDVDNIRADRDSFFGPLPQRGFQGYDCPIIICNAPKEKYKQVENEILDIRNSVDKILNDNKAVFGSDFGKAMDFILGHLYRLSKGNYSLHNEAYTYLNRLNSAEAFDLVAQAEKLAQVLMEASGCFIQDNGAFRIELYYDIILDMYNRHKNILTAADDFKNLFTAILAHEMMHAFHYEAVAAADGYWKNSSSPLNCLAAKETIAEYYSYRYSKTLNNNIPSYIAEIHKNSTFPLDGGYCGALLMKDDIHFKEIYDTSLTDMNSAFDLIK